MNMASFAEKGAQSQQSHLDCLQIDQQIGCREGGLADAQMNVAGLVSPVLCLPTLEVCHCLQSFSSDD